MGLNSNGEVSTAPYKASDFSLFFSGIYKMFFFNSFCSQISLFFFFFEEEERSIYHLFLMMIPLFLLEIEKVSNA